MHVPLLAKANQFRGGGIKSPVHFARFMFVTQKGKQFFFFLIVNASLFPPPGPLINKRKGKLSFFLLTHFPSPDPPLWKGTKRRESNRPHLQFQERQEQRVWESISRYIRPSCCTAVRVVSSARFRCLLSSSPLSESADIQLASHQPTPTCN